MFFRRRLAQWVQLPPAKNYRYSRSILEAPFMVKAIVIKTRRPLVVGFHIVLIVLANYLAFLIRFDGVLTDDVMSLFTKMIPWLVVIRGLTFVPLQLYRGLWRYTGIWDLRNVIVGVIGSTVLFYILVHWIFGLRGYPLSIFIIDSLLLIFFIGGSRLTRRLYHAVRQVGRGKQVLIYGAGRRWGDGCSGHKESRRPVPITNRSVLLMTIPIKSGSEFTGFPFWARATSCRRSCQANEVDEVLLTIPSASASLIRQILTVLEPFKVPIKTLPTLGKLKNGQVGLSQIQDLSVEDLLDRLPVGLDFSAVQDLVKDKRILITGAGGSIGSELSRQIAKCEPAQLILLDKSEGALYDIDMELQRTFPDLRRRVVLADIKNVNPLEQVFIRESPQIIFHAAAYKHVPMMEHHPGEAVLNNVVGTHRLMQLAVRQKAERFILISTDKAVNPTNIMGATKRVGEMYVQALTKDCSQSATVFSAVRFGNVLGSNGSVVPLFLKQIEQGGPVTVTHPEITRYFMTIPEAVLLVLQAATLAQGGEIFVLEMGEQIKLVDMARHLDSPFRLCSGRRNRHCDGRASTW